MARSLIKQAWLQIGVVGIVLFVIVDQFLRSSRSSNFLPAFILLGAFTVPVAFMAYFYRQEHLRDRTTHGGISLIQASFMFLAGGIVGTIVAGVLASPLTFNYDIANFVSLSAIEEAAKLIFPVIVFLQGRYRSEADGVLFGIATGVGFAALETMGTGLIVLSNPDLGIGSLEKVMVIRGLLSPLGHAAWTGLICGAIWHYQGQGKKQVLIAIAYFLLAVVLHSLWNIVSTQNQALIIVPSYIVIGGLGLFLVLRHLHHAHQKGTNTIQSPN